MPDTRVITERTITAEAGTGRMAVRGYGAVTGQGLIVHLLGGELPHVGTVVISQPRPSLKPAGGRSCTTSVFNLLGHKDDVLAVPIAEKLARTLDQVVVVVAGVHVSDAMEADIQALEQNAALVGERLLALIETSQRQEKASLPEEKL
ncbi:MAG: hypothetical protein ACOY9Y_01265 [Bacillota bacterium]